MLQNETNNSQSITERVSQFYNEFPFPHYPIFFRPRPANAYLGTAQFSQALMNVRPLNNSVLVLGCGEMQPYLYEKWNNYAFYHHTYLDISKKSIDRSKWRVAKPSSRLRRWVCDDVNQFFQTDKQVYSHVDAYGVLHHLESPTDTISLLKNKLTCGSTLRVMVYNNIARKWIQQFQSIFKVLKLDPRQQEDLGIVKNIFAKASKFPRVAVVWNEVSQYKHGSMSWLMDTFFNERVINWGLENWLHLFAQHDFQLRGVFDRYGELDDLKNPLWQPPEAEDLLERIADLRFENNFELFLQWQPDWFSPKRMERLPCEELFPGQKVFLAHFQGLWNTPDLWNGFQEIDSLSFIQKKRIWRAFAKHLIENRGIDLEGKAWAGFSQRSFNRLARLGAILPSMIKYEPQKQVFIDPLEDRMEVPQFGGPLFEVVEKLQNYCLQILERKNLANKKSSLLLKKRISRLSEAK